MRANRSPASIPRIIWTHSHGTLFGQLIVPRLPPNPS